MSTILVSSFPTSVWDGTSASRTTRGLELAPDWKDWDRIVAELIKTQTVVNALSGGDSSLTAADIVNVAAGAIAATNVQTALNELDSEKTNLAAVKADSDVASAISLKHAESHTHMTYAALAHDHTYVSVVGALLGGGLVRQVKSAQGTATAAATFNIPVQVPAGAVILGAQLRVDVALTAGTGTSWEATYNTGASQVIATGKAFAINTKANAPFDHKTDTDITSNVTDITITCNAADFIAGGKITAIVYYEEYTPLGNYVP